MSVFNHGKKNQEKTFEFVGPFCDGLAVVKLSDGSGCSYVDAQGHVMEKRFAQAQDFNGNMAVVGFDNGYKSLIDREGNLLRDKNGYAINSEMIINNFAKAGYAGFMNLVDRSCYVTRSGYTVDEKFDDVDLMTRLFDNVVGNADYQYILKRESIFADKIDLMNALLYEIQYRINGNMYEKTAHGKLEAYKTAEKIIKKMTSEEYQRKVAPYLANNEREY